MMLPAKPGSAMTLSCSTAGAAAAGAAAGAAASITEADAAYAVAPVHLRKIGVGRQYVLPVLRRDAWVNADWHARLLRRIRTDAAGDIVRSAWHAPIGRRDGTKYIA